MNTNDLIDFLISKNAPAWTTVEILTQEHDVAGFSLAYLARDFRDLFSSGHRSRLRGAYSIVRRRPDYSTQYWSRVLPLQAVLSILDQDFMKVKEIVKETDHHNSVNRRIAILAAFYCIDMIREDEGLVEELSLRMMTNLNHHRCGDDGLYLFSEVAEKGSQMLEEVLNETTDPDQRAKLNYFLTDRLRIDPFAEHTATVQRYILKNLLGTDQFSMF